MSFMLIVNNEIINTDVNIHSLENESVQDFTQMYLILHRNCALINAEKEAQ